MNGTVWQRLDRALVNSLWAAVYTCTKVSHLPRGRSDHSPLVIKARVGFAAPSSFRFLNMWRGHPSFLEIILADWRASISGVGMTLFHSKMQSLRTKLREWSKEVFGNIFDGVKRAADTYKLREEEFNSYCDESSQIRLHKARAVYLRELFMECEF
ncbi:uncharacterized protein [Coffea arabica]|uniref:Uncharacterized protein n=1 Tax=Coffea arabica TaxID=13443 RepID=A0ABM4UQY8_COFAR